jgi:hypothetical protein
MNGVKLSLDKQFLRILQSDDVRHSCEELAWIQFLFANDSSIMRDAGVTLALMTGISLDREIQPTDLSKEQPKEWVRVLAIGECMRLSQNDNLVELSRIIFEWFSSAYKN